MYGPRIPTPGARRPGRADGLHQARCRTCFDLDNAPYSNMVLARSSTCRASGPPTRRITTPARRYILPFRSPQRFGAGCGDGELYETHHNGLALITEGMHPQVTALWLYLLLCLGNPASARQPVGQDPYRRHCTPLADRTGCQRAHLALSHWKLTPPSFPTQHKPVFYSENKHRFKRERSGRYFKVARRLRPLRRPPAVFHQYAA